MVVPVVPVVMTLMVLVLVVLTACCVSRRHPSTQSSVALAIKHDERTARRHFLLVCASDVRGADQF